MLQPRDRNAVAAAVNQYGVAPGLSFLQACRTYTCLQDYVKTSKLALDSSFLRTGARRMMDWEEEAAEQALATGEPRLLTVHVGACMFSLDKTQCVRVSFAGPLFQPSLT